jgi:lysophospholipase L1-like esterase
MEKTLAFQEIKELIRGAVSITQTPDGICMQRFTEEQLHVYDNNKDFQTKARATSGMTLDFITDAARIIMKYKIGPGSSRVFSNIDVTVNGELAEFHCVPDFRTEPESVLDFALDGKENHVRIYLPCLTQIIIQSLTFHDAAVLKPVRRENIMLAFGDSITQGYDAQHPMGTYAMLVADAFHADLYNKAIGGDRFCTALTEPKDDFDPTFITVAYGTNDWNRATLEDFQSNTVGFFRNLAANYPDKTIFVILPIWRKDYDRETLCGTFESARDFIRKTAEVYPNVHIIDGLELMAHDVALTSDGYLHPNDEGFQQMGRSLIEKIAPVLNQ